MKTISPDFYTYISQSEDFDTHGIYEVGNGHVRYVSVMV